VEKGENGGWKIMLGELYEPKGYALETARAVLGVERPYACNVAMGCTNECVYCYGPKFTHSKPEVWKFIKKPKEPPCILIERQIEKGKLKDMQGAFFSFITDPLSQTNILETNRAVQTVILRCGTPTATLSKITTLGKTYPLHRNGMTIVSPDEEFQKMFEPNSTPIAKRIELLRKSTHPWVSMEPYPVSAIYKQDLDELLYQLSFVDLIVFGKWNYDPRSKTEEARVEYAAVAHDLTKFCKSHRIALHIKQETQAFIEGEKEA
jgi:hypothetical protein